MITARMLAIFAYTQLISFFAVYPIFCVQYHSFKSKFISIQHIEIKILPIVIDLRCEQSYDLDVRFRPVRGVACWT
ncbi:MAG: hypothetical protein CMJ19_20000 [Phycisphaeraceae bacterium]|nr:hypothetical protein [Phycisphaeraceae bacterium]